MHSCGLNVLQCGGTLRTGDISISRATAINDASQIAGFSTISKNSDQHTFHAVVWDHGKKIHDIGTLPGDDNSFAFGINPSAILSGNRFWQR